MPILLKSSVPLRIRYVVSLPHILLASISLMCASRQFEGLGEWLQDTHRRLDSDLRDELCLLIGFPGRFQRFTTELIAHLPPNTPELGFEDFMAYLQFIPAHDYQRAAVRAVARASEPASTPTKILDLLDQPQEWAAYLESIEAEADPQTVAQLLRDAQSLKSRFLAALRRFWLESYAEEFNATQPLMGRSVQYHQAQPQNPNFQEQFAQVTGRLVPDTIARELLSISQVTFVPSCYIGPYVAYTQVENHLIIYYNCRSTPAIPTAEDGASIYPLLKSLADETRLRILTLLQEREMYAQEIVDQLDISQPAVSRHLNLMVAAGVLATRREGNAKYYSLNRETLARLADAIRTFG